MSDSSEDEPQLLANRLSGKRQNVEPASGSSGTGREDDDGPSPPEPKTPSEEPIVPAANKLKKPEDDGLTSTPSAEPPDRHDKSDREEPRPLPLDPDASRAAYQAALGSDASYGGLPYAGTVVYPRPVPYGAGIAYAPEPETEPEPGSGNGTGSGTGTRTGTRTGPGAGTGPGVGAGMGMGPGAGTSFGGMPYAGFGAGYGGDQGTNGHGEEQKTDQTELFVGNLPYVATQEQVEGFFAQYGEVISVKLLQRVRRRPAL